MKEEHKGVERGHIKRWTSEGADRTKKTARVKRGDPSPQGESRETIPPT